MIISILRAIILYLVVICAIKFMGKRQIGELETSELVITFMISDIASIPMQNSSQPLISGLIPIGVLVCLEIFISSFMMKNSKLRQITCGQSVIVINNGIIDQKELNKMRINVYDLFEQLRQMDVFSLKDVSYAIMESNGKLSVLKKSSEGEQSSSSDSQSNSIDLVVVSNGEINDYSLSLCKKDRKWIFEKIENEKIKLEDVFLMTSDQNGKFNIVKKVAGDSNE